MGIADVGMPRKPDRISYNTLTSRHSRKGNMNYEGAARVRDGMLSFYFNPTLA